MTRRNWRIGGFLNSDSNLLGIAHSPSRRFAVSTEPRRAAPFRSSPGWPLVLQDSMPNVHTIYHSGFGHTKLQAEAVHRGAGAVPGIVATLWAVDEATSRLDELDKTDAIIFGCPTYMGSLSAGMKQFIEVAARKWFTMAWKDKIAGAFTNSSSFSGDKLNTLVALVVNAMQH
ncbi:MAG: flavodoxin family protein, partial [Verrucomicrobia bacterium]|nr:flavodoxin family protein [Verrucomicrobiota bacterium]